MSPSGIATLLLIGLTLLGVFLRPYGLGEGTIAAAGALAAVALGLISPAEAVRTVTGYADILLFFIALLLIAWTVEASGFFDWAALLAARSAAGRADRLLVNVFLTGIAITALLSNDATALLLSPMVFSIVRRLRLPALPYVLACTFIADTASIALPFSNPVNLIVLHRFPATLPTFLGRLLPAAIAVSAINLLAFLLLFRRLRSIRFDQRQLPPAATAIHHRPYFRIVVAALVMLALGYVAATISGLPVAVPGLAVAALLVTAAVRHGRIEWGGVRTISWGIIPFVAGMFVLVRALDAQGVTGAVGQWLVEAGGASALRTSLVLTFGSAVGANVVNNLPMTGFAVEAIARADNLTGASSSTAAWAALVGNAIGPNLTIIGSLATMLWLVLLRDRGMEIHAWDYMRVGLIVTPPMLLIAAILIAAGAS